MDKKEREAHLNRERQRRYREKHRELLNARSRQAMKELRERDKRKYEAYKKADRYDQLLPEIDELLEEHITSQAVFKKGMMTTLDDVVDNFREAIKDKLK